MDFSGIGVPNPVGPLVLDFPRCSNDDIKYIIQVLYHGSSECIDDLNDSADEIINRMNDVGYGLVNKENGELVKLIKQIYLILSEIYPDDYSPTNKKNIIKNRFNEFVQKNSPVISSPSHPRSRSPKIMQKVKNKFK